MYTGSLPTFSNREDWIFDLKFIDSESGETVDFTGCTIEIVVRGNDRCVILSGSTDDGKITSPELGVAEITFLASQVHNICAGSYPVGITIEGSGETVQLFSGTVSVVDGVVA